VIPGGTNCKVFKVTTASGVPVTGLTTSSFTFKTFSAAYASPPVVAPYVPSPVATIVELGSGYYSVTWGIYSSAGFDFIDIVPNSTANLVNQLSFGGEVEAYGAAQLAALVARPTVTLSATSVLGSQQPITLVPYRYRGGNFPITLTVVLGGVAVDLTQFSNLKMSIRSADQVSYKWEGGANWNIWQNEGSALQGNFAVTGTNQGILTITIPASMVGPVYTKWVASTAHMAGDTVVPTSSNGYVYLCTVAGTGSGSQPSWPTSPGTTVTDGGITWMCLAKSVWQASTAYTKDAIVTPQAAGTPATGGYYMKCITPGTSGATEPSWTPVPTPLVGSGSSGVTDGTAVWQIFNDPYGVLPAATTSIQAYWELTGQLNSTGETVDIIPSSSCTISRREQGT
jgi:hypothetical protein